MTTDPPPWIVDTDSIDLVEFCRRMDRYPIFRRMGDELARLRLLERIGDEVEAARLDDVSAPLPKGPLSCPPTSSSH